MMVNMDAKDIKPTSFASNLVEDETTNRTLLLEKSFKPSRNCKQKFLPTNDKVIRREKMGLPPTPFMSGCRCGHYIKVRDYKGSHFAQVHPISTEPRIPQQYEVFSSKVPPINKSLRK